VNIVSFLSSILVQYSISYLFAIGIVVYLPAVAPPLARASSGAATTNPINPNAAEDAVKNARRESTSFNCCEKRAVVGVGVAILLGAIVNPWPRAKAERKTVNFITF